MWIMDKYGNYRKEYLRKKDEEEEKEKEEEDEEKEEEEEKDQPGVLKEVSSEEDSEEIKRKKRMEQAKKKSKELDKAMMKKIKEKEKKEEEEEHKKAMMMKRKLKAMFPGIHVDSDLEEAKEEEEEEDEEKDAGKDNDDDDDDDDDNDSQDDASEECSDLDSKASSVGDILHPKICSDAKALSRMLNPDAGMDGLICGKRAASSGVKKSELDKEDMLRLVKFATVTKAQIGNALGDPVLTQVCVKVDQMLQDASEELITNALHNMTADTLTKLAEGLKNNRNPDSKVRSLSKAVFKAEFNTLANKDTAIKALTEFKDGALDGAVKHALYQEWMNDDGSIPWTRLEQKIDKTIKDGIFEEGRAAGLQEANRDEDM
eukprot:TRINITY_DN11179_c0_g1_i2.p1 TRINITY_DN11179_c0_g1~~TRINITY_DN11179_c0_g1_i2.p1  ORF type:complete len:374 (+),score=136.30 TRINITY_DN11179_c0_g1_i2:258-1379(+)